MQDSLTVSEAKTKICPFTIKADTENTNYGVSYGAYCICGDCMAWEYTKTIEETNIVSTHTKAYEEEDKSKITDKHIKVGEYSYGEYYEITDKRYAIVKELPELEKEGYCKRLKNV